MLLFLKERKNFIIFLTLILFHLILISFQVSTDGKRIYFKEVIYSAFSPIQHGIAVFFKKIGNIWDNYFYLLEVQTKNKQMREEISLVRQENYLLKRALQRLKNTKDIQEYISNIQDYFIIARVIGVDTRNVYKSINIDKGSLDGLKKDMVVLDKKGNLSGRIVEPVTLKEAIVQLITDIDSGVGVISKKKELLGVVSGDARGNCLLKFITATQIIEEGEELITSGFDHVFPQGIKVGKVVSIKTEHSLFKKVEVKPYFRLEDLDMVVIILNDSLEFF
ncbi:MAG: rod shape-determining protein MreC [Candidatus Aminicenantaceae bacterium]